MKHAMSLTLKEILELIDKVAASGISVLESIPIPGYDRFEFRDPFGNRVEMIERKD